MNENRPENQNHNNNSRTSLNDFDDDSTNNSVTIFEDEQEINYFNKSLNRPRFNSSSGKRSPLALLNRKTCNRSIAGPSSSSQPSSSQQVKAAVKNGPESIEIDCEEVEYCFDPFTRLSDEIVLHIFTFLPKKALNRVACVNDRFLRVSKDDSLWVRMDLGLKFIRSGAIGEIISRGLIVLRLSQAKIQMPIFDEEFPIEGFQSKLQYLDLSMTTMETKYTAQLLGCCKSLRKLSLEAIRVDDSVCCEISKNKNLEVINLAMSSGLTGIGVELITQLKSLVALNISWTNLETASVSKLVENLTATMLRLNIAGCRTTFLDKREYLFKTLK